MGTQVHELGRARRGAVLVVGEGDLGHALLLDDLGLDDLVSLHVEAVDLLQVARLVGRELRDDREGLGRVHGVVGAAPVVLGLAETVRVPSAAVLVADAVGRALVSRAEVWARLVAWVGRDLVGAGVGFPYVHLVAANSLSFDVTLNGRLAECQKGVASSWSGSYNRLLRHCRRG